MRDAILISNPQRGQEQVVKLCLSLDEAFYCNEVLVGVLDLIDQVVVQVNANEVNQQNDCRAEDWKP